MKEMLKYQSLDLQIKKMENEVNQNEDRKNAIKMQQFLKECQAKIVLLEEKAKEIEQAFGQYKNVYNKMEQNVELINKNSTVKDDSKIAGLIEANESVLANLNRLEKEMLSIIKKCSAVQEEYDSIMKNARQAKSNMQKYKDNFAKVKETQDTQIEQKKKELAELGKVVDPKLLAKYKQKSQEKAMVFVKAVDGKCGGCRMQISASNLNKLKSENFIECENCGRIIYKAE